MRHLLALVFICVLATAAAAREVDVELVLAVDVSRSMSPADPFRVYKAQTTPAYDGLKGKKLWERNRGYWRFP